MIYDFAIIGAGPAGATLARLLGKHKHTLIIDKKGKDMDGFSKPCGGLLSPDAQKALSHFDLTLPKNVLVDPQIFAVKTIDLQSGISRYYQRFYLNLDRQKFDHWLISLIPSEVTLYQGRGVKLEKEIIFMRLPASTGQGNSLYLKQKILSAQTAPILWCVEPFSPKRGAGIISLFCNGLRTIGPSPFIPAYSILKPAIAVPGLLQKKDISFSAGFFRRSTAAKGTKNKNSGYAILIFILIPRRKLKPV